MLVLSRKEGESILIGDDIEVMVVAIREDKIRLGVKAPRNVRVDREEVRRRIEQQGARKQGGATS